MAVAAACGGGASGVLPTPTPTPPADDGGAGVVKPTPTDEIPTPKPRPTPPAQATPGTPTPEPIIATDGHNLAEELAQVRWSTRAWVTDFSKHSVDLTEIIPGGPPKDGIPAIDDPQFESAENGDRWLTDPSPVLALDVNGDVRAYPIGILLWHEIVNDNVGGKPVAVTYCPLCNTAIVFDATLADGTVLDFGVSGNLRFSDLIMYDRQTDSWWQQISGDAIVGDLLGTQLEFIAAQMVSWGEYKAAYPEGEVLSRITGFPFLMMNYGLTPYSFYDSDDDPFLFRGPEDNRLPATERVAAVEIGDETVAFPFSVLKQERVVPFTLGGQDIVVFFKKGTNSALDRQDIRSGRDVGATGVFIPQAAGQTLTFRVEDGEFRDNETDTTWSLLGKATAGPLEGEVLEPVVHGNHLWFSWAVFKPDTIIYRGAA